MENSSTLQKKLLAAKIQQKYVVSVLLPNRQKECVVLTDIEANSC